ncbi:MAG: hypothetical protein NZ484_00850 [Patescibacteria group bacterium]|nr:hypothetical protein [Patescibacteria group bacterium]MDW8279766.1 hypothetical protein [bacterium]
MILNSEVQDGNGAKRKIFWLSGWVKQPLKEIQPALKEGEIIISSSYKYIWGLTGQETKINCLIVQGQIIEVKEA